MEKEQYEVADDMFEKICREQYVLSNVENFQLFKARKKQELQKKGSELLANAFDGMMNFSIASKNERIRTIPEKAINITKNGAFKAADIQAFAKEVIEHNMFGLTENDFDELVDIADKVYHAGYLKEAVGMYQALIILFPDHIEGWLRLANAQSQLSFDYQKILDIYKQCLEMFDHPAVHFSIGVCHLEGKEPQLAKDCFKKALELCDAYGEQELKEQIHSALTP